MDNAPIYTVIKMMETLPEATQIQVVDHLREYLAYLDDEAEWDAQFDHTEVQLIVAAQQARRDMLEGQAEEMNFEQL
jgi:hypothetical protein